MIDKCEGRRHANCLLRQIAEGSDVHASNCVRCQFNVDDLEQEAIAVGKRLQNSAIGFTDANDDSLDVAIELAKAVNLSPPGGTPGSNQTNAQIDTIAGEQDWTKSPQSLVLDDSVAGYQIIRCIGSGGMGDVFLAEQGQPVQRQVALKLIKAGMDSQQVLLRFSAEQQALALMDHPGIARVFDGGMTARGLPYFAMEYVDGVSLTEFCDDQRLSIHDRLKLFAQVCAALAHAHQKGIIHRDIKPSNVLVHQVDGKPTVKVIDFGLAKALHFQLTDEATVTQHFSAMGTIRYMSPEQAEGKQGDADTRTDIYSLGILLFELLTGSTPLSKAVSDRESTFQLLDRIRNDDPIRPSQRIREQSETEATVAANRRSDLSVLSRELRRDLDWIVLKAIETKRERRYETVSAFADDIQRYLAGEPVEARPPSKRYRTRKFASKHRVAMGAASVLATVLIATTAISTSLYLAANSQRLRAEQSERSATTALETAKVSEQKAIDEQLRATQSELAALAQTKSSDEMIDFLGDVMESAKPDFLMSLGDAEVDTRSRAQRVREELGDAPLVQARLMNLVGSTYLGIGRVRDAQELLKDALKIRQRHLPDDDPLVAESLHNLGDLHFFQGRNDSAHEFAQRAVDIRMQLFGPDDPETLTSRILVLMTQLQGPHNEDRSRRFTVVRQLMEQWEDILARRSKSVPANHPDLAKLHLMVATQAAELNEKIKTFQHAATARRIFKQQETENHIGELLDLYVRAKGAEATGNISARNEAMREVLEIGPEIFGGNEVHPLLLYFRSSLQFTASDGEESESLARETVRGCREVYGDEPRTANALHMLGNELTKRSDSERITEGIALLKEAIKIKTECLGPNRWETGHSHLVLGRNLAKCGDEYVEQATFHLHKSLQIFRDVGIVDYSYLDKMACARLVDLAEKSSQMDSEYLQSAIENLDARLAQNPNYVDALFYRGSIHRMFGEYHLAVARHGHLLGELSRDPGQSLRYPTSWIRTAAWAHLDQDESSASLLRSELVKRFGNDKQSEFGSGFALVCLLLPCDQPELNTAESWIESVSDQEDPDLARLVRGLLEYRSGRYESALDSLEEIALDTAPTNRNQIMARLIKALAHRRLGNEGAVKVAIEGITPDMFSAATAGATVKRIQQDANQNGHAKVYHNYLADQLDWVACQVLWKELKNN